MLCPGCGAENPAQAVFCYKCGSQMSAGTPAQVLVAPGQSLAAPAGPQPSYLWGYVHGWAMLILGPLLFLLFAAVLVAPTSDRQTREGAIMFMVLLALATITGYGVVRKIRLGLRLVYIWAALQVAFTLIVLLALVGAPGESSVHIAAVVIFVGLVFWMLCAAYYHKRRALFH